MTSSSSTIANGRPTFSWVTWANLRAPDVRLEQFPLYSQTRGKVIGLLGIDILGPNGTIIDFGNLKLYCYPL